MTAQVCVNSRNVGPYYFSSVSAELFFNNAAKYFSKSSIKEAFEFLMDTKDGSLEFIKFKSRVLNAVSRDGGVLSPADQKYLLFLIKSVK